MSNPDEDPLSCFTTPFGVSLRIADSHIHAKGLFACEKIPAGTRIYEYEGEVISFEEAERREEENEETGSTYIFEVGDHFCLDGAVGGNPSKYINHSCNPNSRYRIIGTHVYIEALRDIQPGEEITYDYDFGWDLEHTPCQCGAPNCRGTINNPNPYPNGCAPDSQISASL